MCACYRSIIKPVFSSLSSRCYCTSHHTALAADTFEGVVLTIARFKPKGIPRSKYGGMYTITLLTGIDPGPQLMNYVKDVFNTACVPVIYEEIPFEPEISEKSFEDFSVNAVNSIKRNGVALKGVIPQAAYTHSISYSVALRNYLDLYLAVVRIKSFKNIKCKYPGMDLFIIRQNTEGEYAMLEHTTKPGVVESLKIITRANTERCARWAFNIARKNNRKKITVVHKANIMKLSDGLFLKTVKDVGQEYPELEINDMIVDNCTMQLVTNPYQFDMLLTPNLYGNIITSIAAGLAGGSGVVAGSNFSDHCAVFEAATRTDEKDTNPNPIALIKASVELLRYMGLEDRAQLIQDSIYATVLTDNYFTKDIGGKYTSDEVVEQIKKNIFQRRDHCFAQDHVVE